MSIETLFQHALLSFNNAFKNTSPFTSFCPIVDTVVMAVMTHGYFRYFGDNFRNNILDLWIRISNNEFNKVIAIDTDYFNVYSIHFYWFFLSFWKLMMMMMMTQVKCFCSYPDHDQRPAKQLSLSAHLSIPLHWQSYNWVSLLPAAVPIHSGGQKYVHSYHVYWPDYTVKLVNNKSPNNYLILLCETWSNQNSMRRLTTMPSSISLPVQNLKRSRNHTKNSVRYKCFIVADEQRCYTIQTGI